MQRPSTNGLFFVGFFLLLASAFATASSQHTPSALADGAVSWVAPAGAGIIGPACESSGIVGNSTCDANNDGLAQATVSWSDPDANCYPDKPSSYAGWYYSNGYHASAPPQSNYPVTLTLATYNSATQTYTTVQTVNNLACSGTHQFNGLTPNTSYYYSLTYTATTGVIGGNYQVYAAAGAATTDTTNDSGTGYIFTTISSCALPNLTAGSVTPTSATIGVPTTFSATISNTGGASTGTSFPYFFQVATASQGGGTVTDLSASTMGALAANSGSSGSVSETFPSAGVESLRACANKSDSNTFGSVSESDYNDNCGSWTDITVSNAAPPTFTGNGSTNPTVNPGGSVTLTWSCPAGQTSATGTNFSTGSGSPASGSTTVNPSQSTSYTVTCGPSGSNATVNVNVRQASASLSANPALVQKGNTTSLSWYASLVQSCTLTSSNSGDGAFPVTVGADGSGNVGSSGSPEQTTTGAITSQTIYTLTCQTSGSPITKTVTVGLIPSFIEK